MKIKFTKMHGLGNDFIIIDNRQGREIDFPGLAGRICRRRFSVGADGILVVRDSCTADLKMDIYNSDGTVARMCGNGLRCFAMYAWTRGLIPRQDQIIETFSGLRYPRIISTNPDNFIVRVNMGEPVLSPDKIPVNISGPGPVTDARITVSGETMQFTPVGMGNPHAVFFVDAVTREIVTGKGPVIENHPMFPSKVNVEFVRVISPGEIDLAVWERGAGQTLACGTGACAGVVAGRLRGLLGPGVVVHLPGGDLEVEWDGEGPVYMTGPACESYQGEIDVS